jgi:hypothetical protein
MHRLPQGDVANYRRILAKDLMLTVIHRFVFEKTVVEINETYFI